MISVGFRSLLWLAPEIFISSTFFDLRQIREELERFILEMGYEPVRHETGAIPYVKDKPLESSAYREVELCDIIINVVGGRFGTESADGGGHSITQKELERAMERGIQVFIFVEQRVYSELSTYRLNKTNPDTKYSSADNARVLEFLDGLYLLPRNNPITAFQTAKDIIEFLRAQWAGLFQHSLHDGPRVAELGVLDQMRSITDTLKQLVDFLTTERRSSDEAIKSILLANHPAFRRFAKLTSTNYRVFFKTILELDTWLSARGWSTIPEDELDPGNLYEWIKQIEDNHRLLLAVNHQIFDENLRLKIFGSDWNDEWITISKLPKPTGEKLDKEPDDIPF
jgi:Domain of unknown function (DUF4062)